MPIAIDVCFWDESMPWECVPLRATQAPGVLLVLPSARESEDSGGRSSCRELRYLQCKAKDRSTRMKPPPIAISDYLLAHTSHSKKSKGSTINTAKNQTKHD